MSKVSKCFVDNWFFYLLKTFLLRFFLQVYNDLNSNSKTVVLWCSWWSYIFKFSTSPIFNQISNEYFLPIRTNILATNHHHQWYQYCQIMSCLSISQWATSSHKDHFECWYLIQKNLLIEVWVFITYIQT